MESIFETENLIVRKFRPGDAERLYAYHLDANVKQWMPNESYADVAEAEDDPYGNGMLVYARRA